MRVVYVDTEHKRVHDHPEAGSRHRARLAEMTERLERIAGAPAELLGFAAVSPARIKQSSPAAIIIGGNTTDWGEFDFQEMSGLLEVIRAAPAPILGICAGHQLVGYAHHATWGSLGPLHHLEVDPDPRFAPGQRKQRGFQAVQLDARCALFRGLRRDRGPLPITLLAARRCAAGIRRSCQRAMVGDPGDRAAGPAGVRCAVPPGALRQRPSPRRGHLEQLHRVGARP